MKSEPGAPAGAGKFLTRVGIRRKGTASDPREVELAVLVDVRELVLLEQVDRVRDAVRRVEELRDRRDAPAVFLRDAHVHGDAGGHEARARGAAWGVCLRRRART